jgi:hypothetical protein
MWKISEVPPMFAAINALADECGFLPSLFGSVAKKGEGRDLDILMVPRRARSACSDVFLERFGGRIVKRIFRPLTGTESYEVERQGRVFNFVFGTVGRERRE